jgi:hypothetical protein
MVRLCNVDFRGFAGRLSDGASEQVPFDRQFIPFRLDQWIGRIAGSLLALDGSQSVGATLSFHAAPQQLATLFDHLVGKRELRRRHGEAERLGGLEVEYELKFGGLHDRQIGRLLALENPSDIDSDLVVGIRNAG